MISTWRFLRICFYMLKFFSKVHESYHKVIDVAKYDASTRARESDKLFFKKVLI